MDSSTDTAGEVWFDYHNAHALDIPQSDDNNAMDVDQPAWDGDTRSSKSSKSRNSSRSGKSGKSGKIKKNRSNRKKNKKKRKGTDDNSKATQTGDEDVCRYCSSRREDCVQGLCANCGKCPKDPDCKCKTCHWCKEKEPKCCCKECDFCKEKPMTCTCVGPHHQRIKFRDGGRRTQKFDLSQKYDESGYPLPRAVYLDPGDATTLYLSRNLIPDVWHNRYHTAKNAIRETANTFVKKYGGPVTRRMDEAKYRAKVKEYTNPAFVWPEDENNTPYTYVRTPSVVSKMVTQLSNLPTDKPLLAIDMEASNLGHRSGLCLLQIRDSANEETFLVDLLVLQGSAFDTSGTDTGQTLRGILEDPNVQKLIFDVRQDSCALYAQAGIKLQGMLDLQIMFMLTERTCRPYRTGMKRACEIKLRPLMTPDDWESWLKGKEVQYPADKHIRVWQERPLSAEFQRYAAGDVEILDLLYRVMKRQLSDERMQRAVDWSAVEVQSTWVKASKWKSSGAEISEGFRALFNVE